MGPTNIIFIVVLLIVAAIVAWAGDVLGSIMGKRRMSLFGLRPRLTSRLIGIITGIFITIGTMVALALTSDSIRIMLLRMDEFRRQYSQALEERDNAFEERDEALMAVDALNATIEQGRQAIEAQQREITDLSVQLSVSQEELGGVRSEVESLTEEIDQLNDDKAALEEEYRAIVAQKEEEAAELESQIERLNADIRERETRVETLNEDIEALNRRIDNLTGQVRALELGEVKVYEGQQIAVLSIDTELAIDDIYVDLVNWIDDIPDNYTDPVTGANVLAQNPVQVTSEQYVQVLEEIRAIESERAIIIVYSAANVVEDQPVPVRIEVTGNYRVYAQGTLIYSNVYTEPVEGTTQPYRAVAAQFFEDARNYLVNERRLIPITSGEALQLTIDDLVEISDRLVEVGFPCEMRLVALSDIYRTDFLVYGQQFTVTILPVESDAEGGDPE